MDRTERCLVLFYIVLAVIIVGFFALAADAEAANASSTLTATLTVVVPLFADGNETVATRYSQTGLWLPVFIEHPDLDTQPGWPFVIVAPIYNLAVPEQLQTAQLWANSLASASIYWHEERELQRIRESLPVPGGTFWLVDTVYDGNATLSAGPPEIQMNFEGIPRPWIAYPNHIQVHSNTFVIKAAHHTVGGTPAPAVFEVSLFNATEGQICEDGPYPPRDENSTEPLPPAPVCTPGGWFWPDALLETKTVRTGQSTFFELPAKGIYYWNANGTHDEWQVDWFG